MNIKEGFKLIQTLTFDDDTGEWTLETHLETDFGFDEETSISPFGLHGNQYPTIKDCKEEIDELFGYYAESEREKRKPNKNDNSTRKTIIRKPTAKSLKAKR